MSEILFVNACVREDSRTRELAMHVLERLGGDFCELDLLKAPLRALDREGLRDRELASKTKDFSSEKFELAKQFSSAKTIVVAAPYWDLMFPAALKLYWEAVTVNGLSFAYNEHGIPTGLCRGERLIYVTTSGGPIHQNFGYDYVCALARGFYGISDVRCVSATGLDVYGANVEEIMIKAKKEANEVLAQL